MPLKSFLYETQLKLRQGLIAKSFKRGKCTDLDASTFEPRQVLFVLAGLIGDSVMSLPAIIEARRIWPEARITVLGKKHNRELTAASTFFDEFYECNADPFSLRKSGEIKKLERWLKEQRFDAAFILLGDQYAHLLARAGIPIRVGVKGTTLENCLTHTYDIGSPRTWGTDEKLNSLRCLGYSVVAIPPALSVSEEARQTGREKLVELGLDESRNFAVLHPFGSSRRQWWKLENVGTLAAKLKEQHNLQTVLIGGDETVSQVATSAAIIDTTGQLSLPELLAVIDESKIVITTDSGPFHIAGALGKRTVGLFRSRRPEHAKQYKTADVVFGENDICMRACSWDRCESEPCRQMQDVSVDAAIIAVEACLPE